VPVRNRLARDAFSYCHLPMVAAIVLIALGMKSTLAHVGDPLGWEPAAALVGGAALYLLACAALYDAGAYLVGTGASSAWEGPAAGVAALVPLTLLAALAFVPPFEGASPLLLGALAAVLAPFGPVAGSALLGDRTAYAPALRRLDSLLVLGPIWAWCAAALLI